MAPYKIVALLLVVSLTFQAGLQVNRDHLMAVLRNYGLLGRALLANLVIVPLIGLVVVHLFRLGDDVATGVLLMAIAPGVPFLGLAGGRAKGGSISVAVSLLVILQALAVLTVPLTAQLVLPAHDALSVPFGRLIVTLALVQLLPLAVGMFIYERRPDAALGLGRPVMIVAGLCIVALLVILGPKVASAVASVYGSRGIMAMLLIIALSVGTGWALGGPTNSQRVTLSMATALRNIGIASLIATTMFPSADVAAAVMTYLLLQVLVSTVVGTYFKRTAKHAAETAA
jgi:BASS family bile acid:Na+ symporter